MKNRIFLYEYGRTGILALMLAACLAATACTDYTEDFSQTSRIELLPSVRAAWSPVTKTGAETAGETVTVLRNDTGKTLYLHTAVTEGIEWDSAAERMETRAAPIDNNTLYPEFGVSAYAYTGTWDGTQLPDYMYDVAFSKSGTLWASRSTYYWPGDRYRIRFFAYAPRENACYVLSARNTCGAPTLDCTVPADVAEQRDLLVAASGELPGNRNTAFPLTFSHALTAIRFACGTDMRQGTVKSISLKNVCDKGVYDMESATWTTQEHTTTFTQRPDQYTTGKTDSVITAESRTFMMIPQTLPQNAQIEIEFDDGTKSHILTADIGGSVWPKGGTVTYKVSTTSINWTYHLTVDGPAPFSYTGGSKTYTVTSYKRQSAGNSTEPVPWHAEYSTDEGKTWSCTRPEWLTEFTDQGEGGTVAATYTAVVAMQAGNSTSTVTNLLRQTSEKGSADHPYNLSNDSGAEEVEHTANCYIVTAPGTYSLPLVYGNAIENGQDNPAAYRTYVAGNRMLRQFHNHLGAPIDSPYIYDNYGCDACGCELVWQDAPGLLTNVILSPEGQRLIFTVNRATIQEGNAVVAVLSMDNEIMWSWHIWVTDESRAQPVTIQNNARKKYEILPCNLGWCDACTVTYPKRSCKVRIFAGTTYKEFAVTQNSFSVSYGVNCTFYQWGRKDPMLPGAGKSNTQNNKVWYNNRETPSTANPKGEPFPANRCMSQSILKPAVKNTANNTAYCNLWNSNNNNERIVKTVYDPSPAGFHVPGPTTLDAFNRQTVKGSFHNGWTFYCTPGQNETVFFATVGFRNTTSCELVSVGALGHTWLTDEQSSINGHFFYIDQTSIRPYSHNNKVYALAVRPVREK